MPVLYTERLPLLQIFTNLITNAVKHHDKTKGIVKVYHKVNGEHYEFFVEDDGPGIDRGYHEKIFVIFQTLRERDTFESTGVGLAIIKKILDDRNLNIRVFSEPGRGAIFSFTWPKDEYYVASN
jgi:light-regulated signal transduction histidine kinase (bacteriophytochrome)